MSVYYVSEPSVTMKGFIGLVIDGETYKTKARTAHAYVDPVVAQAAAKRMWASLAEGLTQESAA